MYEEKLKQEAEMNAKMAQGFVGQAATRGLDCQEPMREGLTQRFRTRLNHSRRERNKTAQLEELTFLLEKNPEISRILDLVDALGHDY